MNEMGTETNIHILFEFEGNIMISGWSVATAWQAPVTAKPCSSLRLAKALLIFQT